MSVTARGHTEPAFQTGFTSLSLAAPEDSLFTFAPPPGATVTELQLPGTVPWPTTYGFPGTPGSVTSYVHCTSESEDARLTVSVNAGEWTYR